MLIRLENSEYIARDIGGRYSGQPLFERLKSMGVPETIAIYPNTKWRMVFDVINYYSNLSDTEKARKMIAKIMELSVHPLNNGTDIELSQKILRDFNKRLGFDKLILEADSNGDFSLLQLASVSQPFEKGKDLTDRIADIITFFKNEYSRMHNIKGMEYHYCLSGIYYYADVEVPEYDDDYQLKKSAVESLSKAGLITEYCEKHYSNDADDFLYVVCKIDENKLMGISKEEGPIGKYEVKHIHHFENNIQEKDIAINIHDVHNSHVDKKQRGNKFPLTIQSGTTWESFYIQFRNDEAVTIKVSGHTHNTSFADMGFADGRTNKPNTQWTLLKLFAKKGGNLTAGSPDARDKYKKHKQLLSDALKSYFSMDYDPFKPYGKTDGYAIKINLSYPETEEKTNPHSLDNEVDEMFQGLVE